MEINYLGLNKEIIGVFLVIYVLVGGITFISAKIKGYLGLGIFCLVFLVGIYFDQNFKSSFFPILLPYGFLPAIVLGGLLGIGKIEKKAEPLVDVEIITRKGKKIIRNVFAGVGVFGASRSGKTASVIYSLLLHFSKWLFSGVIYDYKNGELTEICIPLFGKERVKIFAIHRPDISVRINPIYPKYLEDEKDVNEICSVLLDNLVTEHKGNGDFFYETALSLLSALVLKFSIKHPEYCTLPHIIAFILSVDFSLKEEESKGLKADSYDTFLGLKKFLTDDKRVKIQASSFILGLASEKQTAGVVSTLANALRKISFPQSFWGLSQNDLELNLNHKDNKTILSVLNEPKNEKTLTPFLAMIIHSVTRQMMTRHQEPAFILLDEAPTIKLKNMARIASTMASFGIVTVYCAQDISQAVIQYGKDGFKAILANLSTLFFGRANDPDTGKFYEQYFEPKKIKTRSVSTGRGGTSNTLSEKEVPKVRAHEFTKFVAGKFAFISGGKSEVIQFPKFNIEKESLEETEVMKSKMIDKYNSIIEEMDLFAKSIGVSESGKF
ncbi:type IV secretory system conjugative DNA transfer family protein [Riemerella anatipestifer]|nr:type IV secretory system conjugative DNA transfer family protein [Riemerella anatipestifer]